MGKNIKLFVLTLLMMSLVWHPTVSEAAVKKSTFYYANNKKCSAYCTANLSRGADGAIYETFAEPDFGRITALTSTGKKKFDYITPTGYFPAYFSATPASNKTVYASLSKTNYWDGAVIAISDTGKKIWQYNLNGSVPSKVVVGKDGTIYFGDGNYTSMNGPYASSYLYALTPQGKLKWKVKLTGDTLMSNIQIDKNGTIYVDSVDYEEEFRLYAVTSKGKVKWVKKNMFRPQIGANNLLHYVDGKGAIVAEDLYGKKKWSYKIPAYSYPEIKVDSSGTVYVKMNTSMIAISAGKKKWSRTIESNDSWNSAWDVSKSYIYFAVNPYNVDRGSKLYRFDAKTGKANWSTKETTDVGAILIDAKSDLLGTFEYGKTYRYDF